MKEKIDAMIQEAVFLETPPEKESRLKEDLGFDSLSIVQLIVEIEEMFAIEFEESDLDPQELETVEDVYALVARYAKESEDGI